MDCPAERSRARAHVADADDRLRYLAASLEPGIHESSADGHPDQIRAATTQIRANVVAAAGILLDLAVCFALGTEVSPLLPLPRVATKHTRP